MRLRHQRAPALLLLIPTLQVLAASIITDAEEAQVARAAVPDYTDVSTATASPTPPPSKGKGTKDAPVDGFDGKPHEGPFLEEKPATPKKQPAGVEELRPGATRISSAPELTKEEWAALGAEGDGVMDDPNRSSPKGNTGTEGGVSAKEKERKEQEDKTGEKLEQVPQPPKEALPHPHGEQEALQEETSTTTQIRQLGAQGLEVRSAMFHKEVFMADECIETNRSSRFASRYPASQTRVCF